MNDKKKNVCISCNTLLVHQVTKLRTKSWKLIELGTLTNGLTIVTSRLFLAISNFIYQKERSIIDCFLRSTLDRKKKTWNRLTCEQALRGSLAAGRQRRDCSQARTSEMLNEFAIECL